MSNNNNNNTSNNNNNHNINDHFITNNNQPSSFNSNNNNLNNNNNNHNNNNHNIPSSPPSHPAILNHVLILVLVILVVLLFFLLFCFVILFFFCASFRSRVNQRLLRRKSPSSSCPSSNPSTQLWHLGPRSCQSASSPTTTLQSSSLQKLIDPQSPLSTAANSSINIPPPVKPILNDKSCPLPVQLFSPIPLLALHSTTLACPSTALTPSTAINTRPSSPDQSKSATQEHLRSDLTDPNPILHFKKYNPSLPQDGQVTNLQWLSDHLDNQPRVSTSGQVYDDILPRPASPVVNITSSSQPHHPSSSMSSTRPPHSISPNHPSYPPSYSPSLTRSSLPRLTIPASPHLDSADGFHTWNSCEVAPGSNRNTLSLTNPPYPTLQSLAALSTREEFQPHQYHQYQQQQQQQQQQGEDDDDGHVGYQMEGADLDNRMSLESDEFYRRRRTTQPHPQRPFCRSNTRLNSNL